MTDEALNRTIDKFMGGTGENVPYCSDLNLCAKAEAKVIERDSGEYAVALLDRLRALTEVSDGQWEIDLVRLATANARTMAEAVCIAAGVEKGE